MVTETMNPEEAKDTFKESEKTLKSIKSAREQLAFLHKRAKKEITLFREKIIIEELKMRDVEDYQQISDNIGFYFDLNTKNEQENILKKLYIKEKHKELVEKVKDTSVTQEIEKAQKHFPEKFVLWGPVWRFTSRRKKEETRKRIQNLDLINAKFYLLKEKIRNELYPSLIIQSENLWKDFEKNQEKYYSQLKKNYNIEKSLVSREDFEKQQTEYLVFLEFQEFTERILTKKKQTEDKVYDLIENINQGELQKALEKTSLDEFCQIYPDARLKLNLLAQDGIHTVGEMMERYSFLPISGIGEVTNKLLEAALKNYEVEVSHSIGLRFDPNNKTEKHTEILRRLYIQVNNKKLYKQIQQTELSFKRPLFSLSIKDIHIRSEWAMQQLSKDNKLMLKNKQKRKELNNFIENNSYVLKTYSETLENNLKLTKNEIWSNFNSTAADYYAVLENNFDVGKTNVENTIKRSGLSEKIIENIQRFNLNEEGLKGTLRSWQDFGTKYTLVQKKALIGDEMGLGKTLISIASMVHLKAEENREKFIVVCPASIMTNWEREVQNFSDLRIYKAHGIYRDDILEDWKRTGGVVITTYGTVQVLNLLDVPKIDMLTVDEAHYAKNPGAKRTQFIRKLTEKSEYAVYLTGTPIENEVKEMTQIIKPLNKEIAQVLRQPKMVINANAYRKKIAPVYLRRTKKDVSLELPPLNQIEEWNEFGDEEFEEYVDAVQNGKFMRMRRAAWVGGTPTKSPKLKRLVELSEEASANNDKVLIFTFFRDVIETVTETLGDIAVEPIHGDVSIGRRQEIIDNFRDSTTKNVLVAQINTVAHGLNIQFANTIIFCEPQIKPSLETQAVARAYRMGQVDNVFVYRLLTANSIDELMMDMLKTKQVFFDEFADRAHIIDELEDFEDQEETSKSIQKKIIDLESKRLELKMTTKKQAEKLVNK